MLTNVSLTTRLSDFARETNSKLSNLTLAALVWVVRLIETAYYCKVYNSICGNWANSTCRNQKTKIIMFRKAKIKWFD